MKEGKKLSLYLHIPFCASKCHYCDFLSGPDTKENIERYVELLCKEIRIKAESLKAEEKITDTVFFGGGTPSLLEPGQMIKIMSTLREEFRILPEAEISLELNPGTVCKEKLKTYQQLGINRLSIGLQSANNEELKRLGRIHTYEEFLNTWQEVKRLGFSNINIDLMSSLPGQTLESYRNTLEKITSLKPEHISAYSLIIEEGTNFHNWYGEEGEKTKELPSEETDREMYYLTKTILRENGYERYEISNYSLPTHECRHNIGYWTGKPYLGMGLGASSYRNQERFQNEVRMKEYEDKILLGENPVMERIPLELTDRIQEFMFLGLRRMKGISEKDFATEFGISLEQAYGDKLRKLEKQQLLAYDKGRWYLTERGIDVSNRVFVEF